MPRFRLWLTVMVATALLGLSSVGSAAAADDPTPPPWYVSEAEWQVLKQDADRLSRELEANPRELAAARALLVSIAGDDPWYWPWRTYWRTYRVLFPQDWRREWNQAEDTLLHLEKRAGVLPEELEAAAAKVLEFETMTESERKARAVAATELEGWDIDLAKLGWSSKDIWFSVTCTLKGKKKGEEHIRHIASIRGQGPAGLVKAIHDVHNGRGCLPDEYYTTELAIKAEVPGAKTITLHGSDYMKPRTAE